MTFSSVLVFIFSLKENSNMSEWRHLSEIRRSLAPFHLSPSQSLIHLQQTFILPLNECEWRFGKIHNFAFLLWFKWEGQLQYEVKAWNEPETSQFTHKKMRLKNMLGVYFIPLG